jgi:perosamine synthetase
MVEGKSVKRPVASPPEMNKTEYFIPWAKPNFWGKEHQYVTDALTTTWISGGAFVERLERDFAAFCGSRHALTVASGTAALHVAYLALGIRAGDEIVVPGFGFLSAANIALHMSARPVFCEVDPHTWCMRADDIAGVLTAKTRAIIAVHTYGNVCDMDGILELAETHKIPVIEDVAEAFPSRYRHRLAGTMGRIGTFSFQATKTITTGEGGMVITEDSDLLERMALYRNHGLLRKRHYWHELPGHNFRLTNLQAALGCAQFERLDAIIAERCRVNNRYRERLSNLPGIVLQRFDDTVDPVVWAIALRLNPDHYPQGRDAVIAQMAEAGIEMRPGFYAPSEIGFYGCPPLPGCEQISRSVISPPSYPTLSEAEIDRICEHLGRLRTGSA